MQRVTELINLGNGQPTAESERWLRAALFGSSAPGSTAKAPVGQFFPGAAGGANGTSGFDAPSAVNYGFQVRNGLAYFAPPLSRIVVQRNASVDLLSDIDQWYDRLRQKAGSQANPAAPISITRSLNDFESTVLDSRPIEAVVENCRKEELNGATTPPEQHRIA